MMSGKLKDMTGMRFSRLVVTGRAESDANGNARWNCVCDCGKTTTTAGFLLRNGQSKSCGCLTTDQLRDRNTRHGLAGTPEYRIWHGMLMRCRNPKTSKWHLYGGRGIKVCESWVADFSAFLSDMGPRPSSKHSLDRINGDGNYEPSNCRWATITEQNRNTNRNRIVTYRGEEMPLSQAIEKAASGVTYERATHRLNRGWDVERAVEEPAIVKGMEGPRLVVSTAIPKSLKFALETLASQSGLSLSEYLRQVLDDHVAGKDL